MPTKPTKTYGPMSPAPPPPDRSQRYAAIASDGIRSVVWGVGWTEAEARRDAIRWLSEACDAPADVDDRSLTFQPITRDQFERIEAGVVDCAALDLP